MGDNNGFEITRRVLKKYSGEDEIVCIPDGVVTIGESAFKKNKTMKKLIIPQSMKKIMFGAIDNCSSLETVVIQGDITEIRMKNFDTCKSLKKVIVEEGVSTIGGFDDCKNLVEVVLPATLKEIRNGAFSNCKSLNSINIPEGVNIGEYAFSDCKELLDENGYLIIGNQVILGQTRKKNVLVPAGVKCIGPRAFEDNNSVATVVLPEGVTEIKDRAFADCEKLISISFPSTLKAIGWNAFTNCISLKSIFLPDSLESVEKSEFGPFDKNVEELYISRWTPVIGGAVKNCKIKLIHADDIDSVPKNYLIHALRGFLSEQDVNFTDERGQQHVKIIGVNAEKLMDEIIDHVDLLKIMCEQMLILPNDLQKFIDKATKSKNTEASVILMNYYQSIREKVLASEKRRENAKIKQEDTVITKAEKRANKNDLKGIIFAVTGRLYSYNSRDELKQLVERFGAGIVDKLSANVDYLVTNDTGSGSEKNKKAKELGIEVITEAKLLHMLGVRYMDGNIPPYISEISDKAFYYSKIDRIVIPDSVNRIGNNAFEHCELLKEVIVPDSVEVIGKEAFSNCIRLEKVHLGNSVSRIEAAAFKSCYSLSDINISDSLQFIGDEAFVSCRNIKQLVMPENILHIGKGVFCNCNSLEAIYLPEKLEYLGEGAFNGCESLKDISVSEDSQLLKTVDGILFNKAMTELIHYPNQKETKEYTVPEGVETICSLSNLYLEKLYLPKTFQTYKPFGYITTEVSLPSLTDIVVDSGSTAFKTIDGVLFSKDGTELYSYPCNKTDIKYIIPPEVTSLHECAFIQNKHIEDIQVPETIKKIPYKAFSGCTDLRIVNLPDTLEEISDYAFVKTDINRMEIPESVRVIGDSSFYNCGNLKEVVIPETVESIGRWAFKSCADLKTIYLQGKCPKGFADAFDQDHTIEIHAKSISGIPKKSCFHIVKDK